MHSGYLSRQHHEEILAIKEGELDFLRKTIVDLKKQVATSNMLEIAS